jgi:hypothetical protein
VTRLIAAVAGTDSAAGGELDTLWASIMSETSGEGVQTYESPRGVLGYYTGEVPESGCSAGTTADKWAQNAFYCQADRSILYDEAWLRDFETRAGNAAPAAIMAHEWGHHVQALLGVAGYSLQVELQADCFAGLYLANTEEVDSSFVASDDDLRAMLTTFFELGNSHYAASEWFQSGEHGSAQERIRAFGTGYTSSFKFPDLPPPVGRGIAACEGYRAFTAQDFSPVGPYRLLNLPGHSGEVIDGAYVIKPEVRLGIPTSGIVIDWLEGSPDEIVAQFRSRFPGISQFPTEIDLTPNVAPGAGAATYVEQRSDDLASGARSGLLGRITPLDGRGILIVFVDREQPAISVNPDDAELRLLAEQMSVLYEALARLCSPDDAPTKPVCLDDQ